MLATLSLIFIQRTALLQKQLVGPDYIINSRNTNNNRVSCHQPRTLPPIDNGGNKANEAEGD